MKNPTSSGRSRGIVGGLVLIVLLLAVVVGRMKTQAAGGSVDAFSMSESLPGVGACIILASIITEGQGGRQYFGPIVIQRLEDNDKDRVHTSGLAATAVLFDHERQEIPVEPGRLYLCQSDATLRTVGMIDSATMSKPLSSAALLLAIITLSKAHPSQ